MYLVDELDLAAGVALVRPEDPGYATSARQVTAIEVTRTLHRESWPDAAVHFGDVQVRRQVTGFVRRSTRTSRPLGQVPLSLPPQTLRTRAIWWTISASQRSRLLAAGWTWPGRRTPRSTPRSGCCRCSPRATGGTWAGCQRPAPGDRAGSPCSSTTGRTAGAGFAERGFRAVRDWLGATARQFVSCECAAGMPLVHPVAQVRERERAAVQAGRGPAAGQACSGDAADAGTSAADSSRDPGKVRHCTWQGRRKRGDPRRGGERGSPNGPAPGGQSRSRHSAKPTCIRAKLPIGHGQLPTIAGHSAVGSGP